MRTIEERFAEKVDFGEDDDCWEWKASCLPEGKRQLPYGHFKIATGSRSRQWTARAPQVAFYLAAGYWPGYVCHTCDNAKCVNPNHLYDGSQRENMQDAIDRGRLSVFRHRKGGNFSKRAKVTIEDAEKMRKYYDQGFTQVRLAKMFGLTQGGVSSIVRGKTRKVAS